MNSNLDGGAHIQNNTSNGKCSNMATGTTAAAAAATDETPPTSVVTIAALSANISKSISDTDAFKCDRNNSTNANISNFFRKLSGDFSTSVVADNNDVDKSGGGTENANNVTCDKDNEQISASCPAGTSETEVSGNKWQPSYVSGCFAHRHQCGAGFGDGIDENLTEAELRQIISELTSKMEHTERMNWMCKFILFL